MNRKFFKPFFTKCRECGTMVAILRTVNGKTIAVKTESLTEQERIDISRGIGFFYNPTKHIYHYSTCSGQREKEKAGYGVTIDNRYGD